MSINEIELNHGIADLRLVGYTTRALIERLVELLELGINPQVTIPPFPEIPQTIVQIDPPLPPAINIQPLVDAMSKSNVQVLALLTDLKAALLEFANKPAARTGVSMGGGHKSVKIENPSGVTIEVAKESTLSELNSKTPDQTGTWGYNAGINGPLVLSGGKKILAITTIAGSSAASFTINGGDVITVPANASIQIGPISQLVDPTLSFTDTVSFFVEHLT